MGRSRGGLTTKIHALVDADGLPVRLELTAGQAADAPMAEKLLSDLQPGATILADKAYDTDAIRNFAKQRKCWANIPAKANRKQTFSFSRWVYRQRNLVERFFNRIKQMRGLATRYDRRADNYLAALKLAATRIWIASANESASYGKFCGAMIINHVRTDRETVQGGGAYFEIPDVGYRTAQTYKDRIAILLAGMAAEYVLLGAVSDGAGSGPTSDLAQATRIATVLQSGMGMGDRLRHSLGRSDHELQALRLSDPGIASWVDETLWTEFERAKQLVCSNLTLLEAIAEELDANGKVSPDQVAKMAAKLDAKSGIAIMAGSPASSAQ
jgi:transposase